MEEIAKYLEELTATINTRHSEAKDTQLRSEGAYEAVVVITNKVAELREAAEKPKTKSKAKKS
jgi:hypothetical protein